MTSWLTFTILKTLTQQFNQPIWKTKKVTLCSLLRFCSLFRLCFPLPTIPPTYCKRPTFKRSILSLALSPAPSGLKFFPAPKPTSVATTLSNNDFFQKFIQICIERVKDWDQIASSAKAKEKALDRSLKPQNLDIYYGYLHIKCYYFCQQYKDHFEVVGSFGHKCILFATGFQKDSILN